METVFCPYCGCGCTLRLKCSPDSAQIERTLPDENDVVSDGKPCVKGLTIHEMINTNRLSTPMLRRSKQEELEPCSWEEAFSFIKDKISSLEAAAGAETNVRSNAAVNSEERTDYKLRDKVFFLGSGECTNEANYLMSKLCRSHFGSNNIDSCARLCHAATGVAFKRMFGMSAIPRYSIEDVAEGDCFLFIGTDPMEDYPVMFNRVIEARRKGASVVSIDIASNSTADQSDFVYQISPNGILPLLSHLIVMLVDGKDYSRRARNIKGFDVFVDSARKTALENPPSSFGFTREGIDELYWVLNDAKKPVIGFGMGLTQHGNGTQNVYGITGLAMLLDAVLFPNRGKVNIQGAGDVGADPEWRPRVGSEWRSSWNDGFMSHDGKFVTKALYDSDVEFVWIMGGNPSQSLPDLNSLDRSMQKKFVVFQHHHPSRTMEFADVVLPSTMLPEESGCVTNGERRVRGLYEGDCALDKRRAIGCVSDEIKGHSCILAQFAQYIGAQGFEFEEISDIFNEMVSIVPGYWKLERGGVGSVEGMFARKEPRYERFVAFTYDRPHFSGTSAYPFVFTTARNRFHFCTGSATRCSRTLRDLGGRPSVLINPLDAEIYHIADETKIRITSEVGNIEALALLDASVKKRVLVAPFHFDKLLVNKLTPMNLDPESGTPCYKEIPVNIETI